MNNLNDDMNEKFETDEVIVNSKDTVMPGDEISANKYNLYIGLTLLWGFVLNYILVNAVPVTVTASINPILFFILYIVCCIAGTIMCKKSDNPVISFIGYNLIVVPIGFVLNIALYGYSTSLISTAVALTGIVTLLMMVLGTMFPSFFAKIGRALGITLLITIIVELIGAFFLPSFNGMFIDYIVVLLFCGYIGFDWGRANMLNKTVDNAIDSAAEIYLDIINLFLRLLSILARSDRK